MFFRNLEAGLRDVRSQQVLIHQYLIPCIGLAGIGRFASHDTCQRRVSHVIRIVEWLVLSDGCHPIDMLLLETTVIIYRFSVLVFLRFVFVDDISLLVPNGVATV